MLDLQPPRHTPTPPTPAVCSAQYRSFPDGGDHLVAWQGKYLAARNKTRRPQPPIWLESDQ